MTSRRKQVETYDVAPAPREPRTVTVRRTIPAIGDRGAVRDARGDGTMSRMFGAPWTPIEVLRFTPERLYARNPNGLTIAFWLADPWEIQPAAAVTFWKRCWACHGAGELWNGAIYLSCVECGGFGDVPFDPWMA